MARRSLGARRGVLVMFVLFGATSGLALAQETGDLKELEVLGVVADPGGQARILLRSKADKRGLSMVIGQFEAVGIALPLEGVVPPRPYTHDLILDLLRHFDATVARAVITELKENTYYATIVIRVGNREVRIDSRPSDAVAVALRVGVPILASEKVLATQPPGGQP
ncbi:MAG TPA: bifunctional nuclease family protein [Candidatus Methylomirabilis sp.]|nr:bifunctional nuclease family protein [Candidatus Methylomirabilis sp.]